MNLSKFRSASGFTLIEVMIAVAILALGIVSFYVAQGNSLRASGRAENIQTASLLARQIMTEQMLAIEQDMDKGSFPDDKEEQGDFQPPFDKFRWEFYVRKVDIPLPNLPQPDQAAGGEGTAGSGGAAPGGDANQPPANAQESLAQLVTKKISESVREISTKIIWDELGVEQSITVTSHISKL
jgi:general secretion pathway protein I